MTRLVRSLREPLVTTDGDVYAVHVYGRQREDDLWEGWIEFVSPDGSILRTPAETTQPKLADLEYWASGLSPVYFDGARRRAQYA
jgi:hypothetical protein